jgi:hypothetical protein
MDSIRREVREHVRALHEQPLKRLLSGYFASYYRFRTHVSLAVVAVPEVGGLPYYDERIAA